MILLTGATGFIGKHLLAKLKTVYGSPNVLALTSKPIVSTNFLLHNNYIFDNNLFIEAGYSRIETIIHAGAFTPKNTAEANQIAHCNRNISNTEKLLYADFPSLKKIIYLSTLDIYQQTDSIIAESSTIEPATLYGHSKWYGEKMVETRAKELGIDYQILRVGHVYGPGEEKYQKIIPISIARLLENQSLFIFGKGNELRSFIYIDDLVEAITNSVELKYVEGPINLVSKNSITIHQLLLQLITIAGTNTNIEFKHPDFKGRDLTFDNSKMAALLLKRAETPLAEGLKNEFQYMKGLMAK